MSVQTPLSCNGDAESALGGTGEAIGAEIPDVAPPIKGEWTDGTLRAVVAMRGRIDDCEGAALRQGAPQQR